MQQVTKEQAQIALHSLMELMVDNEKAWLSASLLNWLVENETTTSAVSLGDILWAAANKIDDVLTLIQFIASKTEPLHKAFGPETEKITRFCDKHLGRRYFGS